LAAACNTTRTFFFCRSNVSATSLPVFPEAPSTKTLRASSALRDSRSRRGTYARRLCSNGCGTFTSAALIVIVSILLIAADSHDRAAF
jgi:hypothetical protein